MALGLDLVNDKDTRAIRQDGLKFFVQLGLPVLPRGEFCEFLWRASLVIRLLRVRVLRLEIVPIIIQSLSGGLIGFTCGGRFRIVGCSITETDPRHGSAIVGITEMDFVRFVPGVYGRDG